MGAGGRGEEGSAKTGNGWDQGWKRQSHGHSPVPASDSISKTEARPAGWVLLPSVVFSVVAARPKVSWEEGLG